MFTYEFTTSTFGYNLVIKKDAVQINEVNRCLGSYRIRGYEKDSVDMVDIVSTKLPYGLNIYGAELANISIDTVTYATFAELVAVLDPLINFPLSVFPPYYSTKVIQYLTSTTIVTDALTYIVDKKGTRDGEVLQGACYDFGSDATAMVQLDSGIDFEIGHSIEWYANPFGDGFVYPFGNSALAGLLLNVTGNTIGVYNGDAGFSAVSYIFTDKVIKIRIHRTAIDDYGVYVNDTMIGTSNTNTTGTLSLSIIGSRSATFGHINHVMGLIQWKDENGDLIHWWQGVEGSKNISFDSIGGAHGTILNATLANFHATNNNFPNKANTDGYSEGVNSNDNLLTGDDSTFDTGIGSWQNFRGIISWDSGLKACKWTDNGTVGGPTGLTIQGGTATTKANTTYCIRFIARTDSLNAFNFTYIGEDNINFTEIKNPNLVSGWQEYEFLFTTSAANARLYTGFGTSPIDIGDNYWIDNVEIEKTYFQRVPLQYNADVTPTSLDIFGNTPTYLGRVRYNVQVTGSNCLQADGTNKYLTTTAAKIANIVTLVIKHKPNSGSWTTTTDTVAGGTTITDLWNISGTSLEIFKDTGYYNGILDSVQGLDSGGNIIAYWTASLGEGDFISDKASTPSDLSLVNFTTSGVGSNWVQDDGATDHNLTNGFDKWEVDASPGTYVLIPYDVDGNPILTDGDTFAGHTWKSTHPKISGKQFHNGSENGLKWPICPELKAADTDGVLFTGDTPNELFFADLQAATINPIFLRDAITRLEEFTLYSENLTGDQLTAANNYFNI